MKKIYTFLLTLAFFGLSMSAMAQNSYEIHGGGMSFSVIKNQSFTLTTTANIQGAIDAIKTDAAGAACTIKFGNGTSTLNIATSNITFDSGWGLITLTGKLQSSTTGANKGTIFLTNDVSVDSKADIENNAMEGAAFFHNTSGTLTISSGTLKTTNTGACTIGCLKTGMLIITGGKVEATSDNGFAIGVAAISTAIVQIDGTANIISRNKDLITPGTIYYAGTSATPLIINGGTIENVATTGVAVSNYGTGKISIESGKIISSGGGVANVSSGIVDISGGTISAVVAGVGNAAGGTINITGGTISSETNFAVANSALGTINISGGLIMAKEGHALYNIGAGQVNVTGGIGFAYGSTVTDVISGVINVPATSKAVMVAWNKAAGNTTYDIATSDDILVIPDGSAKWNKQDDKNGISVNYDITKGFIPIEGITINGDGVETIANDEFMVYPNPTSGKLTIDNGQLTINNVELFDVLGKKQLSIINCQLSIEIMDVSDLSNGIYFLKITTDSGIVTKKIIKR